MSNITLKSIAKQKQQAAVLETLLPLAAIGTAVGGGAALYKRHKANAAQERGLFNFDKKAK